MVKNFGGNKSKKLGRKFVNRPQDRKVRFAEEIEELYAVVTKLFGNGMAEVKCIDDVTRLCIFRKKFKGRSKRDNMVSMGTVVLIGVRNWEVISTDSKKLEKCDLLEVYSPADVNKLQKMASWENWSVLSGACELFGPKFETTEGMEFVDQQVLEYKEEGGKKARQTMTMADIYGGISDSSDEEDEEEGGGGGEKATTKAETEAKTPSPKKEVKKPIENVKFSVPEIRKKPVVKEDDDFNIDDI